MSILFFYRGNDWNAGAKPSWVDLEAPRFIVGLLGLGSFFCPNALPKFNQKAVSCVSENSYPKSEWSFLRRTQNLVSYQ